MAAQVLVISDGTLTAGDRLVDVLDRAGLLATLERDASSALSRLRAHPRPVVIDAAMPGAEKLVERVRAEGALSGCTVVAVVPQPSDAAFSEALAWGVDEVIPVASLRALSRVAQVLKEHDPAARSAATQGTVLVAATSAEERLSRARPLRNAGYEVRFAASLVEYAAQLGREEVRFAVVDGGLFAGGVDELRARLSSAAPVKPVIVVVSAHEVDALSADLAAVPNVRVLARHDPPEDAIFLGNELVCPALGNLRASARLLHATVVSFRIAGHEHPTHGITYNVSGEGMYVRTLVPPPRGSEVWLELRPPMLDGLVHLEATVVWNRRFGSSTGATAPAGFGVHFTGGSEKSRARWNDGYARLASNRRGQTMA